MFEKVLSQEELQEERRKDALRPTYVNARYKCEDCIVGFDYQQLLDEHLEQKHNKNISSHQCEICKMCFNKGGRSLSRLKEHVKNHYTRWICTICHKMSKSKDSYEYHYKNVHDDVIVKKQLRCERCDFVTDSAFKYRIHMRNHKEICNKTNKCPELGCGKLIKNKYGLKLHMLRFHSSGQRVRRYNCEKCPKTYKYRQSLHDHMKSHNSTGDSTDRISSFCVQCKKQFSSERNLANHIKYHRAHRDQRSYRFTCDVCGEKFPKKCQIKEHIEWTHLNIVKLRCHVCNKPFRKKACLNRHITYVHEKKTMIKDKICDYCEAAYSTTTQLTVHTRKHTGERPLQCSICSATFANPAALYIHNKRH